MEGVPGLEPALARRAETAAAWIAERKQAGDTVTVAHHIDADGLAAGAIAMECLARAGVDAVPLAARSLDDLHLQRIRQAVSETSDADGAAKDAVAVEGVASAADATSGAAVDAGGASEAVEVAGDALWFCDFGSTAYMHFPDVPRLVCDHHELVRDGTEEDFAHLNPLLDGIPGDSISGAGCAFLAAYAYDAANIDLVPLALVGATGDLQDRRRPAEGGAASRPSGQAAGDRRRSAGGGDAGGGTAAGEGGVEPRGVDPAGAGHGGGPDAAEAGGTVAGFHGANAALLALGQDAGLFDVADDLAWFGPETRPLRKFLAYGDDPAVPGVTHDMRAAEAFLLALDVPVSDGGERTWADLDGQERTRVRSGLVRRLVDCGLHDRAARLWRPVVRIAAETPGHPTRELQEFGTLLNSTARYDEPATGLAVARGDRGDVFQKALGLRDGHRQNLVKSLDAFCDVGVQETAAVQWVHLEDRVRDTVVGIVCGMALDGLGLRRDKPLVGFAYTPEGDVKVSSRAPAEVRGRIDLAAAMREGSAAVGGQGGGHKGAAGASIPRGTETEFLAVVDGVVADQLGIRDALPAPPAMPASPASAREAAPTASGSDGQGWEARPGQNTLF